MNAWVQAGIAVVIAVAAYLWLRMSTAHPSARNTRMAWMPKLLFIVSVAGAVGVSLSGSVMYVWESMAVIVALAVLFRIFVVPRLRDKPQTLQSVVEAGVKSAEPVEKKKTKRKEWILKAVFLISIWFAFGRILSAIYGMQSREIEIEVFTGNVSLFGLSISSSILTVWLIIAVTAILAVLFRLFVVPRFRERPKGLQNLVEISIEGVAKYTNGMVHAATEALACYIFTIVLLMVGSALVEIIGLRPPMADLKMTASMALITFVFINYYGIKEKGVGGRIKSMMEPSPVMLPIRIITDFAVPVSLACRLFGNMIGGLIVMDLLKIALGAYAIGIPSVVGLYFNIFHPLIQAYIFVTLSLTFINEAVE